MTPGDLLRLQQPAHFDACPEQTLFPKVSTRQQSRGHHDAKFAYSSHVKGRTPPVIKPTTLAAARRLAKVCFYQDHQQLSSSKHKALLFSDYKSHPSGKLGPAAPIVSRHLKQRRARADSYSSSSSDSSSQSSEAQHLGMSVMARDLCTMYEAGQGGISRITEDLANSLYLEKPTSLNKPEYITSPSSDSTSSNHSLFSERSHASDTTDPSDNGHYVPRTSAAHPSAARILSLHQHSPKAESITPRRSHVHATPASHARLFGQVKSASATLDDTKSRWFARRNAIAPIADIERNRSGKSSFGPMRTARPSKAARIAVSHVSGLFELWCAIIRQ